MKKTNTILIAGILILIFFSCKNNDEQKGANSNNQIKTGSFSLVVKIDSTDESKIQNDVLFPVNQLAKYFEKHNIQISTDNKSNWSGYLLKKDTASKELKGALSDVSLIMECNKFFDIKDEY